MKVKYTVCMRCKSAFELSEGVPDKNRIGKNILRGICPICGAVVSRLLKEKEVCLYK